MTVFFYATYAAMEGPAARLVAQAMEPKGGTPERRWRKGAGGRISKKMPGRAIRATVQKEKIHQKQK